MIKPSQAKHGNLIPLPNKSSKGGGGTSQCVGRQSLLWIWGYFPHTLRESRKKQNRPFLSLDDVSSGYDVWNNSCHLLIMRSSGLRTKPVSKNGRAGRWKDPGPSMTSMDHKTDQPYKGLHLRTSGHTGEPNSSLFKATDLGFLILAAESPTMALVTKIKSRPLWGRWGRRGGRIFVRTSHCVIMTINQTQNCMQNIKVLRNTHTSKIIKIQKWSW